ncbi:putative porin [Balneolaceae bacterium YR4-1]|uniref:Putative porin n=1 Tax=Halalkalibaculum roseum TaxID=2709311 RepID=A0A6M1T744_9BACT|nr:putative porin [Halalkalibaculum roseum]NGP76103.1 putative porin [Halalkalibaculum roseum]
MAQVDSSATDSIAVDTTGMGVGIDAVTDTTRSDSVASDSVESVFKVVPWKYHRSLGSELTSSDSTLRWQIWPDWTYKTNRDPGVISYRLGTIERNNAFLIDAQEPRYQRLSWEGMNLNDPVSGSVYWNLIPTHKINSFYSEDNGLFYDTNFYLRQYYLNRPLTKLNYEESKFDYRSLEFLVSQNFSQKTNVELSYWDRRAGGEYGNSNVAGRQIYARVFHQLDHRQSLKLKFLSNKYTAGEPFGYVIPEPENFPFDRFIASANESRAESVVKASNFSMSYYRRGRDTTAVTDNFHTGLFYNNRGRELEYSADSTSYQIQSFGGSTRKWLELNPLSLEGGVTYEIFKNKNRSSSNLDQGTWSLFEADGSAVFKPIDFFEVNGEAAYGYRSDGFDSYRVEAGAGLYVGDAITLEVKASSGTIMPTPQQLYWNSTEYRGDAALVNEEVEEVMARLSLRPFDTIEIGVKGQVKELKNSIMVGTDSSFYNSPDYRSLAVTPYFNFENTFLELSGSATYQQFENSSSQLFLNENERVWLKGSLYVKGYLFDRATYVKAGFSGMMSPFRYQAADYNPVLDFWQPLSDDSLLPVFNRLDFDLSARVRTIMILLRWENILDDVTQRGYFETAGYPMSQRRFIFGIRTFFRN